jgi:branched-subunit amino acid ABC-type transport system permease component
VVTSAKPDDGSQSLRRCGKWIPLVVSQAINVLYALDTPAVLALSLTVLFGLLGVLNIPHSEFVMIGAYCAHLIQS